MNRFNAQDSTDSSLIEGAQRLILACRQLFSPGNLSFSRIELNIILLRSTRGSTFDFEFSKKKFRLCEQTAPCLHVWLLWHKAGHLTCGVCCTMSLGQYLGRLPPLTEDLWRLISLVFYICWSLGRNPWKMCHPWPHWYSQYFRLHVLVPLVIHFHIWLIKCFDTQHRDWSAANEWILLLTGICRSASSRQSVHVGLQLACYGSKLTNLINDCAKLEKVSCRFW